MKCLCMQVESLSSLSGSCTVRLGRAAGGLARGGGGGVGSSSSAGPADEPPVVLADSDGPAEPADSRRWLDDCMAATSRQACFLPKDCCGPHVCSQKLH